MYMKTAQNTTATLNVQQEHVIHGTVRDGEDDRRTNTEPSNDRQRDNAASFLASS